jgi:hypothetical protein
MNDSASGCARYLTRQASVDIRYAESALPGRNPFGDRSLDTVVRLLPGKTPSLVYFAVDRSRYRDSQRQQVG